MFWMKKKYQKVKINLRPLSGVGRKRKTSIAFVKKFLKKSGNFQAVLTDLESAQKVQGTMFIYGEIPSRLAKKLEKKQDKLGFDIEFLEEFDLSERRFKKMMNIASFFIEKKQPWVYSAY